MQTERAYEVEKLPGKVSVERCKLEMVDAGNGKTRPKISREIVEADAGYMVYFPAGHSIRVASKKRLVEFGFDGDPPTFKREDEPSVLSRAR